MKKEDFESFKRGMAQAKAYVEADKRAGFVTHAPIDIKAIQTKTQR